MVLVKINYASVSPVIKITYDETPVYIKTSVNNVYAKVVYGAGGITTVEWGDIEGTLSNQTDLQTALDGKFDDPTGTTAQYIRGDGSLATFPTIPSGTVTSVGLSMPSAFSVSNSPITSSGTIAVSGAGNTGQYVRGDGSLATFPTTATADKLITEVYNQTGATLTKGTVVYINGAHGNLPTVTKALATGDATSAQTFGLVQTDITNNNNGYVVVMGKLGDLDTQVIAEGSQLYLSSTTAGAYTTTKQYAPNHLVYIGVVVRSHPTQGVIEVRIQNGYELDEIHDVSAQTPSNNDGLFWESSTNLWKNKSISTVLGYTPQQPISLTTTGTSGPATFIGNVLNIPQYEAEGNYVTTATTLTINGTTYDLSANRTWTIPTHDAVTIGTANGLSLVGQVLSLGLASSTTNGALSSTDWNTFNNKQNALTNPVTGTGTSGQIAYWSGTNTQTGSNNLFWDETNNRFGIGTNTPSTTLDLIGSMKSSSDSNINTLTIGLGAGNISTNTAIGYQSLNANTTGSTNTAVGYQSLLSVITGVQNTALGYRAGRLTTANQGTFIGDQSGVNVSSGAGNVLIGYTSGQNITTGGFNTILGTNTRFGTTSSGNASLGAGTGFGITGNNNIFIGLDSGRYYSSSNTAATAYNNSIMIGYRAKQLADNQTNQIVIGYDETGLGSNTTIIGNASTVTTAIRGNLLLGTTTDGGQRLQVQGDAFIKGSGNTSGTTALTVQNSDAANMFRVSNDGTLIVGSFSESPIIYPSTVLGVLSINSASLTYYLRNGGAGSGRFIFSSAAKSGTTTATQYLIQFNATFNPTSGTGLYTMLEYNPTINQTGGANGITRGLYVNPTLTAAADWRSIEMSNNSGWGIYQSGASAKNYFAGNTLLGTTTDAGYRLDVNGTARVQSKLSLSAGTTSNAQINLASSTAPTSPNNGDIWFDGTDLKIRVGGITKTFTLL